MKTDKPEDQPSSMELPILELLRTRAKTPGVNSRPPHPSMQP